MSGRKAQRLAFAFWGLGALSFVGLAGCSGDSDACLGRTETCLSLTLSGAEGVAMADQLEVMIVRQPKPSMPMMALSEPRPLPFKVAVLWPDGPGTVSVRSYLGGQINGATPELTLDLRNGDHDKRMLTLFPPLSGLPLGDMAHSDLMHFPPDLSPPPPDMSAPPPDQAMPPDMTVDVDLSIPADMTAPPG